jgi:hypothetical protein
MFVLKHLLEDLRESGYSWLIDGDATKANARLVKDAAKREGMKVHYSSGRTMHGTPVVTLEVQPQ